VTVTPTPTGTGPFTFRVVGTPQNVTVVATPTGFLVTPAPGFAGTATFRYVAIDAFGIASSDQLVTLSLTSLALTGAAGVAPTIVVAVLALMGGLALLWIAPRRRTS
jgi:hypothetical protein